MASLLGLAALLFGASCGPAGNQHNSPPRVLPPDRASASAIPVTLQEFGFEMDRDRTASGLVKFMLINEGGAHHEFMLVPFDGRRYGLPVAEHEALNPGQSGILRARLEPGRYRIVCLLITTSRGSPESHLELGMVADFEVTS